MGISVPESNQLDARSSTWQWGIALGLPAICLAALPFVRTPLEIAAGVAALAVLMASINVRIRLFTLVGLLPFAHAGFGVTSFGGFGAYDAFSFWFLLFFVARFAVIDLFPVRRAPLLLLAAVMVASYIPGIAFSAELSDSIKSLVQLIASITVASAIFMTLTRLDDDGLSRGLVRMIAAEAAVIAMIGLYQEYRSSSVLGLLSGRMYFTLFNDPNYYAGYLLMALALSIGLVFTERLRFVKLMYAGCSAMLTVGVISTVSRSALAVLVVLVLFYAGYFLFQKGRKKLASIAVITVAVGVVGVLVATDFGGKFVDLFTLTRRVQTVIGGKDASLEQRESILTVGKRIVESHPIFGIGIGAFEKTFDRYRYADLSTGNARSAHNTYFRVLAESGILGLTATLIALGAFLFVLVKAVRDNQDDRDRMRLYAALLSVLSFILMSATLDQMMEPHFWVIAGIALAMAVRLSPARETSRSNQQALHA